MEFRQFGERRSVQRPSIDSDELCDLRKGLKGQLDLSGVRVEGGDHGEVAVEGAIIRSVVSGLNASGSQWGPMSLADVEFQGVDLSNSVWAQTTARRVEVISCRATGWRLGLALAADLYVADTRLDYATVQIDRVKGLTVFERCTFAQAQVAGDLSSVLFLDCDLDCAEFAATGARGCDLRTSRLAGAHGLLSLRGARVSEDQVAAIAEQLAREVGLQVA